MAWNPSKTILDLVAFAWAGFGASFGPTILLSLYWRRLSAMGAFAGMITGAVIVVLQGGLFLAVFAVRRLQHLARLRHEPHP